MSKETYVGGTATITSNGEIVFNAYDGDANFTTNGTSEWTAKEGHFVGDYEKMELPKKPEQKVVDETHYFTIGWWSKDFDGKVRVDYDTADQTGFRAQLEDVVYFQLKVNKKVPLGTKIKFKLWDYDSAFFMDWANLDDDDFGKDGEELFKIGTVRDAGDEEHYRITIKLYLTPDWVDQLEEDKGAFKDGCLDFHWTWTYNNTDTTMNKNLRLSVYPPQKTLRIKPAYEGYGFPEIRTADGDIVIFSTGIGITNDKPSEVLKSELDAINDEIEAEAFGKVRERLRTFSDELRHSVAIKQLKKGYLANNMGKIEFSRRIYTQAIFDNSGEAFTVTKAANFGYRKDGKLVTTKGISQLDYFKEVGAFNTIAKASKELLGIFDFASDLVSYAMDDKPALITTSFAPIDFIVAVLAPSILDPIKETWDTVVYEQAERAKDKGIEGINDFLQTSGGGDERYGYAITKISQEVLNKLLKGEYKTLKELNKSLDISRMTSESYEYQTKLIYTIFHHIKKQEENEENLVLIDAIFINQ